MGGARTQPARAERGSTAAGMAVVLALGAAALATLALLGSPRQEPEPAADLAALEALEARVAALEESVSAAAAEPALRSAAPPARVSAPGAVPGAMPGALEERLQEIEARIAKAETRTGPEGAVPSPAETLRRHKERAAREEGSVDELRRQVMDDALGETKRLRALSRLRGLAGGRSREVVLSMIELYRASRDNHVRADVFRQLSGVVEPELRDVLIEALRDDDAREVREEAAETLGAYREDPAARDALTLAAESDPHPAVRREAQDALAGRR